MDWLRDIPAVDRKVTVVFEVAVVAFLFIHAGAFHWLVHSWHYIITFKGQPPPLPPSGHGLWPDHV